MLDLLLRLELWLSGSFWLKLNKNEWPSGNFHVSNAELPEKRAINLLAEVKVEQQDIYNQFSKLTLIRVIAFSLRFITNCKAKGSNKSPLNAKKNIQSLSVEELERARLTLVKVVQRDFFKTELHVVKNNKSVSKNSIY